MQQHTKISQGTEQNQLMTIVITVLKTLQNSFSLIILGSAQPKGQIPAVEFRKTSVGE